MARSNPTQTPSGILTFLGGLFFLAVFAAIIVQRIHSYGPMQDIEQKRAESRSKTRNDIDRKYQELLNSDGWVDKAKGIAHIQIADAMKLTATELAGKKVGPSTVKVEAPLPVIAPAPGEQPLPALPSSPFGADMVKFDAEAAPAQAPAAAPTAPAPAPATAPITPSPASAPAPAAAAPAAIPAPAAVPPAAPAPAPVETKPAEPKPAEPATSPAPDPAPAAPAPASPAPAPAAPQSAPAPDQPAPQPSPSPAAQ